MTCVAFSIKFAKTNQKFAENSEFCEKNYGVEFQLFEKSNVRGKKINDVYKWLSSIDENGWNDKSPRWNFFKYLVDVDGSLKAIYSSNTNPLDNEIMDGAKAFRFRIFDKFSRISQKFCFCTF